MNADIKGALAQLNKYWHVFEHNGKRMTKPEVKAVLQYGLKMGYTDTGQITDKEVDYILSKFRHPLRENNFKLLTKEEVEAQRPLSAIDYIF